MRLATLAILLVLVGGVVAQSGSRFEIAAQQDNTNETSGGVTIYSIHDKGSGIEVVCVARSRFTEAGISCVPTGRNWK